MTAIWWVRRDLRLHDNPALDAALAHRVVLPLFVLDSALLDGRHHRDAARRKAFLFGGLQALDESLRARGSRLIVRTGPPHEVVPAVAREAGAGTVFAAEDYSPYARRRDEAVAGVISLQFLEGTAIRSPRDVLKDDGSAFKVFTPFSRAWLREPPHRAELIEAPQSLPPVPDDLRSDALPVTESQPEMLFPPGEEEALRRLHAFAHGHRAQIREYADGRNRLDIEGTSALSPYLRFGMVSPRLAAVTALEAGGKGAQAWLSELIWRDFYLSVLYHWPAVLRQEFDASLAGIEWRNDPTDIDAWQEGRTGYPIVDAAMRQLSATGWMHNRGRMIVASFLVKHLLVDWRIGEAWFMRKLVDSDPAANNGGWQWTAGVGTDAAPYFRVFNPVLQAKRFDPEGAYVRNWVPELAQVPAKYLQEPWRMPLTMQDETGVRIGRDYPEPIIDLAAGRQRAIEAYRRARARA